ncbi:Flavocytochrome c [Polyplosphaeria fusca]|uniref:Fumarate reductase n=1 Tax=Polyplosphaeria fusca TaxID=682080 RepID=A0A9P4V100_9PLEO|nr:Flavocytochrome c [Polyplosphaeria fusca]
MSHRRLLALVLLGSIGFILAFYYNTRFQMRFSAMQPPLNTGPGAIVVGAGLAGLSAASQLLTQNIPVLLLERATKPGGNSIKASSGINGAPTRYQSVSDDAFYADTIRSAGSAIEDMRKSREKLIATLTNESKESVEWLADEVGVDLSKVSQLGGHSIARTHRGSGQTPPGAAIVTTLLKALQESALFQLKTSCTVTKILSSQSRVTGVRYVCNDGTKHEALGPVIVTSGGFAGDAQGLLSQYRPDLANFPSTNEPRPGSHALLRDLGARLIDMGLVQVHPTGFIDPANPSNPLKFLAAEVLRGEGGLLLMDGKRFVNELQTRENMTAAIMASAPTSTSPKQWNVQLVLDEGTYESAKSHVGFYLFKSLMRKCTIADLGANALDSIRGYANAAAKGPDHFHRTSFANWKLMDPRPESVVYVGSVTPVVHFTMGGVMISERAEVLREDEGRIEGLWAAGEITGGVHGGNRLGGSSLLECVVFGRRAGNECAEYVLEGKGDKDEVLHISV